MAAFVNDRTALIMAAVPRYAPPTDRGMFLTPSSAVFKLASDGQSASPASFTFKATLLNMSGTVAFSCSAGITPTVNGNEVTVTYANFAAVSGTITATITVEGVQYTQVATLARVADGANGAPGAAGAQGARGNVDIAAVTNGSVWSDSEAVAALVAGGYGAPKSRDMVTLYKADRTFGVQKMFNGSAWIAVDYVYNGNMFVKGSIMPEAIDTRGLAIRDAQGNIILGAGSALPPAYAPPGTLNSEVTLGSIGFTGDVNANFTSASKGAALNDDPAIENPASWSLGPNISIGTKAGGLAVTSSFLRCAAGLDQVAVSRRRFSVDPARTYSLTAMLYADAGNNRNIYIYVNFYDVNGARLSMSPSWGGTMSGYTYGGLPPAAAWTRQGGNFGAGTSRGIPVGTVAAEVGVWFQYSVGSGSVAQAAQDVRIEDITAAAVAATTSTWAGTSGRPSDDAIRNNMLDLSWWKRDAAIPWTSNNEFNRIVTCGLESGADVPIAGPRGGSDLVWYACEVTGNGESGGGWNGPAIAIDPNKTYRFVIPICRLEGTGQAYWGTDNVCALNTQSPIGNPYFANWAGLVLNRWYLFVGYIYPAGSTGNTNESAGIWDCSTGEKVLSGANYCSKAGDPNVYFRAYQYYASANAKQVFGRPMINLVDGTEPSLREYFAASAVMNRAITMGADGALSGAGGGKVTLPGMGQNSFRIVAQGSAAAPPAAPGFYFNGARYEGGARSYNLIAIRRSDLAITHDQFYDLYGAGQTNGKTAATLAADLNWHADRPGQFILVLWTHDEPRNNRLDSGLPAAMYRNGASSAVFGSTQFMYRSAYALIAISGCGEGNGAEAYQGAVDSDPNAWLDVSFTMMNGNLASVTANYTPRSLRDYGFSGDYNATNGATIGANLAGQFTKGNISTFIQGAAIGLAQIDTASIGNLSAMSANIGLLRTSTWGGRMEIESNTQRIYDDSNNLVVQIGRLDT